MKNNIIKSFLLSLFLLFQTPQLSFCMEQDNLQYQTYSLLFYKTLTSKYFMAAVFLCGISPFSPFLSVKNLWKYSWSRFVSLSHPKNNTSLKKFITKKIQIDSFDTVCYRMSNVIGNITFDNRVDQNNLMFTGEEAILNALDIQVINSILTISPKAEFNLQSTILPQIVTTLGISNIRLDITLGISNINKLTVNGRSNFIFKNVSKDYFELNAQQGATIQSNSFNLTDGTFNFKDHSKGVINGNIDKLTITANNKSSFEFIGDVSKEITTTLNNSKGNIKNNHNFENFIIDMNDFSSLDAQGNTQAQDIILNYKSIYNGQEMKSQTTKVNMDNDSLAYVTTETILSGEIGGKKSRLHYFYNNQKGCHQEIRAKAGYKINSYQVLNPGEFQLFCSANEE